MSNTDWKDETVQELKKGYMAMIMDRDERIAILTAGSEAMQEDARNNTATIKAQAEEIRTIKNAIEDIKIYCNNPSAWDYYDETVSQKIRAILKAAGMV